MMLKKISVVLAFGALLAGCDTPAELPPLIGSIDVQLESDVVELTQTVRSSAVVRDRLGNELPGRMILWSSSDERVAMVDSEGIVTAKAAGTARIIARSGGRSGHAEVTVPVPGHFLGHNTMYQAAGQNLPAVVFDGYVGGEHDSFHLKVVVTDGYLEIGSDAGYQHSYTEEHFIDGNGPFRKRVRDRGDCRVTIERLECASILVSNIEFVGFFEFGGIVAVRDLSGEGMPIPISYAQVHIAR